MKIFLKRCLIMLLPLYFVLFSPVAEKQIINSVSSDLQSVPLLGQPVSPKYGVIYDSKDYSAPLITFLPPAQITLDVETSNDMLQLKCNITESFDML